MIVDWTDEFDRWLDHAEKQGGQLLAVAVALLQALTDLVLADNVIRAVQAACWYWWRMPPRRSRLRTCSRVPVVSSGIGEGSACIGRAFAIP